MVKRKYSQRCDLVTRGDIDKPHIVIFTFADGSVKYASYGVRGSFTFTGWGNTPKQSYDDLMNVCGSLLK